MQMHIVFYNLIWYNFELYHIKVTPVCVSSCLLYFTQEIKLKNLVFCKIHCQPLPEQHDIICTTTIKQYTEKLNFSNPVLGGRVYRTSFI